MSTFSLRNYVDTEKFSSRQHVIFSCLLFIAILLVLGKYITPIDNLVSRYVEMAESEANNVAGAALITFGAARLINAAISFAQEVSFSVGFFGGADFSPFKVLEPVDDTIERFSEMLFYMLIAFKIMAILFTPLIVLGNISLGIGLIGVIIKNYLIPLKDIKWPRKLVMFGLFAYIFPLSFLLAMQLGNLALEDQIQKEFKVFSNVIDEADLEKISKENSDNVIIEESDEQQLPEEKIEEIPSETDSEDQPSEPKWWWPFSSNEQENGDNDKNVSEIVDEKSWWEFWKGNDDDPGMFDTFSIIWDTTIIAWDHVAQATKTIGILVLNANSLVDASLTLLALVFDQINTASFNISLFFNKNIESTNFK